MYGNIPRTQEQFQEPSYLIYSSDGGKVWKTLLESEQKGIPKNAQLQQVQYVPERDGKLAEIYLGGYGGIWQATINNDGKPSAFKSVNWDGLGENPNFNLWNTNLEYDPIDDVLIASILGQGGWILNRSPLEAAPAATAASVAIRQRGTKSTTRPPPLLQAITTRTATTTKAAAATATAAAPEP